MKVFALVEDTPMKADNPEIVDNDNSSISTPKQNHLANIVSNLAKKPPLPVTPLSSKQAVDTTEASNSNHVDSSKLWTNQIDELEDDSTSSDDEQSILEEFRKLSKKLKRKAVESPEGNALNSFEKVLSKKQKKKLRKSQEKQKK